jgi:hypothetical protein
MTLANGVLSAEAGKLSLKSAFAVRYPLADADDDDMPMNLVSKKPPEVNVSVTPINLSTVVGAASVGGLGLTMTKDKDGINGNDGKTLISGLKKMEKVYFFKCTLVPTDLSVKKSKPSSQLNQSEYSAIKQLIVGYRESAAFLLRSAEELEQLLLQQA